MPVDSNESLRLKPGKVAGNQLTILNLEGLEAELSSAL